MKLTLCLVVAGCMALTPSLRVQQPNKSSNEPLVEQVRAAIDKGKAFLKNHQRQDEGSWESDILIPGNRGGQTALAVLALLNSGARPTEDYMKRGLEYLRTLENPTTYVRSLQTMVFVDAGLAQDKKQDKERIQRNVNHLIKIANYDGAGNLLGWGYDRDGGEGRTADNSNTQYALLALWVAHQSGVEIDKKFWEKVRVFYVRTQQMAGGWVYRNSEAPAQETLTMTVAGLCGLYMAQIEMSKGHEFSDTKLICGKYPDNESIKRGLNWISAPAPGIDRFSLKHQTSAFYNLYGIERLGRLSGQRFIGAHDWYREGCMWLVSRQKVDGKWAEGGNFDQIPNISTSFALLFLSKGRTPVLISKLAHGPEPRQSNDQDWNRRRNELRHLVDFVSTTVFKKMPMTWQTVDMRRQNVANEVQMRELTSDLLQSPILYFTGHQSPAKRFTPVEKAVLKEYVENGGFILGAACCALKEFAEGFQVMCQELWPHSDLADLELDHPIWNMQFEVKPGSFGLKGISMGCKTVAVLATENICGLWEINRRKDNGEVAFRLGANIVAYATGLEPPKDRLTHVDVGISGKDNPLATPPRGYFQVGQLIGKISEEADWRPAPQAMSKLVEHLRETAGLDAVVKTSIVPIDHKDLTKYKFLYMHGRKDFKFSGEQLERLRFNLSKGGALLFADACCGKDAFDIAFRRFIGDLFPKGSLPDGENPVLVPIPQDDVLFSKDLNDVVLTVDNIKCRTERGAAPQPMRPALEGVKIGKRWVVIYSKYDIGCALEKHQSADCIGYNYQSAMSLARAAVLYHFRP